MRTEVRLLSPFALLGLGRLLNRFLSPMPLLRQLCLRHYMVARSSETVDDGLRSATVVVPARNERGNIEAAVLRTPRFCDDIEYIFIEGHSRDGTYEEMERVKAAYPGSTSSSCVSPARARPTRCSRPSMRRAATCL